MKDKQKDYSGLEPKVTGIGGVFFQLKTPRKRGNGMLNI
jgi:hypothetical protein